MARPIRVSICASALRHNYAAAKRAAPRSKVLAVVKANGYGHGVERVARALGDADGFGTVELDSAVMIRERGYKGPVLLLEGFFEASELGPIAGHGFATVVHCNEQLRMLEKVPGESQFDVWFKINTGMNRLGFRPEAARSALERLHGLGRAKSIMLMTHFALAESPDGIREALRRFNEATAGLPFPRSLANSAAIFAHPESHADAVRFGISLYGATPFPDRPAEALGVRPAMTLASELIAVQELRPGDCVGYGSEFRCTEPMRIGVVACGYADGYPRHAPSGTPIVVNGVRTKLAGRVSMDMITVDLTPVPDARIGTPVVVWGEGMPIDEVAVAAKTVGYELMCGVTPRVPVAEAG